MVDIAAVAAIGERIVDLLRQRQRADLAARALGPLTAAFDVRQLPTGEPPATEGLSVSCVQIGLDGQGRNAALPAPGPTVRPPMGIELSFLIVARSAEAVREQAMLAWAMLVFDDYPMLKEAPGDPLVRLAIQPTEGAELARLCGAQRLAFVITTRGVVLESPPPPAAPPPITLGRRG